MGWRDCSVTKFNMHVGMWSSDQTRMWVVENQSRFCVSWKSPACALDDRRALSKAPLYWKKWKPETCPIVRYHWLLSTLIYLSTFPESNAVEFCLDIIRIYGDVQNDFRLFTWKFPKTFRQSPNVVEDVQRLLKVSKDSHDAFGHSNLENSNTTFSAIYSRTPVTRTRKGSEK